MNNVLRLPASSTMTVDQALDSAKAMALVDVLVGGYDAGGDLVIRSSRMTRSDALWLAERLRMWALDGV